MIVSALQILLAHRDLSRQQAQEVLAHILSGGATEVQVSGLLMALAVKGESVDELVGFATAMRAAAAPIGHVGSPEDANHRPTYDGPLVDTCGTGGYARSTFNISTASALVVAGAGVRVAKHGNRSNTSRCGSADVLESLGVNLQMRADRLGECLHSVGIAFLFAPLLHPAMRHVQPIRRALGVRTIFNLLGPLTNPAGARIQIVGAPSVAWADKLAAALLQLGALRAFVVHGDDGLGEFSTTAPTYVAEVRDGAVRNYSFDAVHFGISRASPQDLDGGDISENAAAVRAVLAGALGPKRDIVLLNAAAALVAAEQSTDFPAGLRLAADAIDSGAAREKLERLIEFTQPAVADRSANAR